MGEPNKGHADPEKGLLHQDDALPSPGITNVLSKAGEGLTNALSKAGESILGAGSVMKDASKKMGEGVGSFVPHDVGGARKKSKLKNRAKADKRLIKESKRIPREEPKDTNIVGNITKLLPANTFLMFQTLAPLATNDGKCERPEVVMTSIMLFILASTCMLVCFTDTVQFNGKVYHGLVTPSGLWNPSFKGDPALNDLRTHHLVLAQFLEDQRNYEADKWRASQERRPPPPPPSMPEPNGPNLIGSTYSSGNSQYKLNCTDFLHAVLSAIAFASLTMLTNPVSTCFYPNIPSTVVKTLPLLVGFVISAIFAFSPPARNGVAHPLSPKVPSVTDNFRSPDPKGVVHAPTLPPKPPSKGVNKKPDDDDDDDDSLTGSAKRILGKLIGSPDRHDHSANHRGRDALEGVKSLTNGLFNKYENEIKEGAAKVAHTLGDDLKKEASHLLGRGGSSTPGVANKELHVPALDQIQEVAKSPYAEALMAGLMSMAGAGHPSLTAAAHAAQSAYTQGAKDAVLQIHQDIQTATSAPLAGLSRQSSVALTRGNSMLQSAGNSLSLPSVHEDLLFYQAAHALQNSGLVTQGADAVKIALATGQALLQAGLHPGNALSPQAQALSAFNLGAAGALVKDAGALVQQGGKSLTEVQDELARQQSAFSQGLNAQLQTLSSPATSVAHNLTTLGSQILNQSQEQRAAISQGTFAATLASAAARETGSLLQVGAEQGLAGVRDELAKKQGSITQPVSSLAQDVTSMTQQGAQAATKMHADVMKQKAALVEEVNEQVQALLPPATSVAQDIAALRTGAPGSLALARDEASQKLIDGVNAQFAATLAQSMARGMSMRMHAMPPVQEHISQQLQPAASVAIDVASLLQQGSLMHTQLAAQQAALSQGLINPMHAAFSQGLINPTQAAAQQVVETHLRRLASLPPQPPQLTAALLAAAQPAASVTINTRVDSRPVQQMRDNAGLVIEDVTDAAAAGQALVAAAPSVSQMRTEMVASTSDAARQTLAAASARLWRDQRAESTEITDSISIEEITSESETEGRNYDRFRAGDPGSSSKDVKKMF